MAVSISVHSGSDNPTGFGAMSLRIWAILLTASSTYLKLKHKYIVQYAQKAILCTTKFIQDQICDINFPK